VKGQGLIRVRTYERGVEDETLACGTGSVASALVYGSKTDSRGPVKVSTLSGEQLEVYFTGSQGSFSDVWLKGQARRVFRGTWLGK
jgi:diaminopimelate epimerase